jgi:hypothetical protein
MPTPHHPHHLPTPGGSGKGWPEDGGSSSSSSSGTAAAAASGDGKENKERDPFGFRELKGRYSNKRGEAAGPEFPPVTAEDAAAVEERLARTGRVRVGRNVFGVEGVTREMTEAWEAGVLPPQLHARDTDQLLNRHMCVTA